MLPGPLKQAGKLGKQELRCCLLPQTSAQRGSRTH